MKPVNLSMATTEIAAVDPPGRETAAEDSLVHRARTVDCHDGKRPA